VADPEAGWVVLYEDPRRAPVAERSLVLTAMELEHALVNGGSGWQLRVPAEVAREARAELATYEQENRPRRAAEPVREIESGAVGAAAYAGVLILFAAVEDLTLLGIDWRAAGRLDAGDVLAGEWWRTVTALTLHLDLGHLTANLAFGLFFGLFAGRYLGSGLAWCSILLAGAAGNGLNALLQAAEHRAVGASTAVFAALGLLSAYVWRRGYLRTLSWPRRLAPVVAGIALLAYTGTGDENTDVVAHLTGFACGFGLGLVYGQRPQPVSLAPRLQWVSGGFACLVVGMSWWLAATAWLADR
jgi:rhomboid protease GluP